ncbi:unnamed protein product, partial [Prorocentrum cordatum]
MEFLDMSSLPDFDSGAVDWSAMPPIGAFMGGKGMPLPQAPIGLQPPGFWQPWGERYQPPPLVFTSETPRWPPRRCPSWPARRPRWRPASWTTSACQRAARARRRARARARAADGRTSTGERTRAA